MPSLSFTSLCGAAAIDANAYLLRLGEAGALLLDVGQPRPGAPWLEALDAALADAQAPLGGVWLSHAHADHLGGWPELLTRAPRALGWCTPETRRAAAAALLPTLSGARPQARARASALAERLTALDAPLRLSWPEGELPWQLVLRPVPCGHIPGAAALVVDITRGAMFHRVCYLSDFSLTDQPLTPGLALDALRDRPIDTLIMEGVLADAPGPWPRYALELDRLASVAMSAPSGALIAVSALGEAPQVVAGLDARGCEVVAHEGLGEQLSELASARLVSLSECARLLRQGRIVVAAGAALSATSPAGQLARELVSREGARVVLLNSLHQRSPAGALWDARDAAFAAPWGARVARRAQLAHARLPCHATRADLMRAARALAPARLVLVHGRERALEGLARAIRNENEGVIAEVCVPRDGEVIWLDDEAR